MKRYLPILAAATALAGCANMPGFGSGGNAASATATLAPTRRNTTAGTVRFTLHGDRVLVVGEVRGLKPNSEHGFHVHEKGDCSSGDGNSAGGHFNPQSRPHGGHGGGAFLAAGPVIAWAKPDGSNHP